MFFKVDDIHTFFGKSHILQGVSLELEKGEIVCLLGRNGVGKSTTLKSIMGLATPEKGSIQIDGTELRGERPYKICRRGIGYVPEERRIFPNLTVHQNLQIGVVPNKKVAQTWTIDRLYDYFPQLKKRERQKGKNLSGGEQQMLTIARSLLGNPKLLLVDEPTEGLSPLLVQMVIGLLRDVQKDGCSILLVEHAVDEALGLASRAYIMSKGTIVYTGTPEELYADNAIRKKYLEV